MTELFNTVSNSDYDDENPRIGNSIMDSGDVVLLEEGIYTCLFPWSASPHNGASGHNCVGTYMLHLLDLHGEIKCKEDDMKSCVLNSEARNGGMNVQGTGGGTLTIRAIWFEGGGLRAVNAGSNTVADGAQVEIQLCAFVNCAVNHYTVETAPIYSERHSHANIMGTVFNNNDYGGGDIQTALSGTYDVLDTCPSPYTSITPIKGTTPASYKCLCDNGYSGTIPNCSPNACQATTTSTDDGSDGNFYCVNGGNIGGTTGSCFCTCNDDWVGESCESTPSPTASPTQSPTRSPTQSPTQTPTTSPTLALPSSTQTPTTSPALAPTGPTTSAVCPAGDTMDNLKCPLAHRDELDLCSYGLYCCKNWYGETASCSEGYEVEVIETGTLFGVWWQSSPPMP